MSLSKYNLFSKNPSYSNKYCPYCGRLFSTFGTIEDIKNNTNKEHLIGRDFVPRNSFESPKNINFIFRACSSCNTRKADFERQVSSVSLLNSLSDHSSNEQKRILQKAQNDYSGFRFTRGKKVIDATITHSINLETSMCNFKVGFCGPPQVDETVIANLAFMHMQGLIYFIFRKQNESIHLYKKYFHYYNSFWKDDWGNPSLDYLRKQTATWTPLMIMTTANNNFKIYIKTSDDIIFWLLEWNKFCRVCGFIGEYSKCSSIIEKIPEEDFKYIGKNENKITTAIRRNTALKEDSPDFIFNN